jgi:hypothetical protein
MTTHRRVLFMIGGVLLVLVAVGGWVLFGGQRAHESSEEQARKRLTPGAGSTTTGPAVGLYRYEGSGTEKTTFPPLTEDQGPKIPATVTAGADGCWVLRVDYNTHHYQDWTYCMAGGRLEERGGTTLTRRYLGPAQFDNTATTTCDPGMVVFDVDDKPGTKRTRHCTGTSTLVKGDTTFAGTMTVVGHESLPVGGQPVDTVHVRYDLTYTGGQVGTEQDDNWFATPTGLLVKNQRRIKADTNTSVGHTTYTEDGQLALTGLLPV